MKIHGEARIRACFPDKLHRNHVGIDFAMSGDDTDGFQGSTDISRTVSRGTTAGSIDQNSEPLYREQSPSAWPRDDVQDKGMQMPYHSIPVRHRIPNHDGTELGSPSLTSSVRPSKVIETGHTTIGSSFVSQKQLPPQDTTMSDMPPQQSQHLFNDALQDQTMMSGAINFSSDNQQAVNDSMPMDMAIDTSFADFVFSNDTSNDVGSGPLRPDQNISSTALPTQTFNPSTTRRSTPSSTHQPAPSTSRLKLLPRNDMLVAEIKKLGAKNRELQTELAKFTDADSTLLDIKCVFFETSTNERCLAGDRIYDVLFTPKTLV